MSVSSLGGIPVALTEGFMAIRSTSAPLPPDHRAVVLARDPDVRRWIDHELFGEDLATQHAETLTDAVASLTLAPPPHPQCLIVDAAEISDSDVGVLAVVRASGWAGRIISIGNTAQPMRKLLRIDVVLPRTLVIGSEVLRKAIRTAADDRPT